MIPEQEHQTITYKNLVLDMDSYTAAVDGVSFDLTQREFEVLRETSAKSRACTYAAKSAG